VSHIYSNSISNSSADRANWVQTSKSPISRDGVGGVTQRHKDTERAAIKDHLTRPSLCLCVSVVTSTVRPERIWVI
jgi:hypothetical protein